MILLDVYGDAMTVGAGSNVAIVSDYHLNRREKVQGLFSGKRWLLSCLALFILVGFRHVKSTNVPGFTSGTRRLAHES